MTLMSWLHSKLTPHCRSSDRFEEALHATEEFTTSVRSLREQIQPYALERDPFAAMAEAHITAVIFEREQESRSHEGPPH